MPYPCILFLFPVGGVYFVVLSSLLNGCRNNFENSNPTPSVDWSGYLLLRFFIRAQAHPSHSFQRINVIDGCTLLTIHQSISSQSDATALQINVVQWHAHTYINCSL